MEPQAVAPYLGTSFVDTSTAKCMRSMPKSCLPVGSMSKIDGFLFQRMLHFLSAMDFAHLCTGCKSMRAGWEADVERWTKLCVGAAAAVEYYVAEVFELSGSKARSVMLAAAECELDVSCPVISIDHVCSVLREHPDLASTHDLWSATTEAVSFHGCGAQAYVLRNCTDGEWLMDGVLADLLMPTPPVTADTSDVESIGFWRIEDTNLSSDDDLKSEVEANICKMGFTLDEGIDEGAWLLQKLGCHTLATNTLVWFYWRDSSINDGTRLRLALLSTGAAPLARQLILVREWGASELIRVTRNVSGEIEAGSSEFFG
eukprot:gnl/MRDRNA2_/MRDRNA2_85243_c0_seq1.p1 gnl/MRDRNA2_/MRDRNA2_85243_c0~~gnl/MRDRNA2_/MRDRNA2_85243_c0_seq1.p1  ORF type:complete len:338 (-),score=45.94 gnl/MRDRNA2_/MRDRNA2_85243_c0_seq1:318-1265(-)